jgi:hypothetical protein
MFRSFGATNQFSMARSINISSLRDSFVSTGCALQLTQVLPQRAFQFRLLKLITRII